MTTEENKRMLALSYIVADLKAENIEMTQRVHQLTDDYNEAVRQQHGLEKRKDEDPSRQTLGEMMKMRDHCDELERKNGELEQRVHQLTTDYNDVVHQLSSKDENKDEDLSKQTQEEMQQMRDRYGELERKYIEQRHFAKEIKSFVKDKDLYMKKGASCGYEQDHPVVGYASCQECSLCLDVIGDLGVICKKRLAEANVAFPNND